MNLLRAIGRGFGGVLRFGGRDGRASFWPYAAFIVFLSQIAMMAPMLPAIGRLQSYALAHPEQTRITSGPGHYSVEIRGSPEAMGPIVAGMVGAVAIAGSIAVLLLAAAVARRLHDRDRRGYWGLLPLPFLAAGLALMPKVFAGMSSKPGAPDLTAFLALFINNFAYLAALGILIVLLAGPGTPGPNRFGPPPGEGP
jgi:uncharacterized membrane protein YhaH (DUF805 family)